MKILKLSESYRRFSQGMNEQYTLLFYEDIIIYPWPNPGTGLAHLFL